MHKQRFTFEKRKEEASRMRTKYKDRIPVIIERKKGSVLNPLSQHKFIVPCDLTVGQLLYVIRKRMKLTSTQSLFFFIGNTIPSSSTLISALKADEDGFLYIEYDQENTFG
jgi:GABA(A) receptor-associated protein